MRRNGLLFHRPATGRRSTWPAALTALLLTATAGRAELPGLDSLRACTESTWRADVEAWADYAFERHVVLRDLDRNGEEKSRTERHFRMTPDDRGFDERLVTENGRPATDAEIREFRRKQNFTRNYLGASKLEFSNPLGENLVLIPALREQEYRLVDEVEIGDVPCYRMVFDARPESAARSPEKQLQHALSGSACVSVEGCHTVRLELETVRPIHQRPARIDHLRVLVQGRPAEASWVPEKVEAQFDFVVLGRHIRRLTTYTYSRYRLQDRSR